MILEVECENRLLAIEVAEAAGIRTVTVDGQELPCDCVRLPNGHYSLIIDGRVHDFIIEVSDGKCSLSSRDGSVQLAVMDARRLAFQREVEGGQAGLQRLSADMPGKVIRVLVQQGDSVAYDQGLLVLEAMKMQNEIRAPKSGIVREIRASAGATVATGEFLLSIE